MGAGAPVTTEEAMIVAESVTVELPWLLPTDVIVTATG
jgi:hypothetical protein